MPYFWSDQYDVKLQMLGVPTDYDAFEIIEGDAGAWEFVAAYGRDGRTIAVLGTIPNGCTPTARPSTRVLNFRRVGQVSSDDQRNLSASW